MVNVSFLKNGFFFRIGQYISTKAVSKWTREDITDTYKYPESKNILVFINSKRDNTIYGGFTF